MKTVPVLLIFLLINFNLYHLWANEKRIVSEGRSTFSNVDKETAFERALEDALRKAVEQGVGLQITSQSVVRNYQLISDEILSKSSGYVKDYKILKYFEKDGLYVVKIMAHVKIDDIKNDLQAIGILLNRKNLPRVLIIVNESFLSQHTSKSTYLFSTQDKGQSEVESYLASMLVAKGFYVLDSKSIKQNIIKEQAIKIMQGNATAAKLLGNVPDTEVALIGEVQSSKGMRLAGSNFVSVSKALTIKVVRVDTGEILVANTWNSSGAGINDTIASNNASKRVAQLAGDQLITDVLNKFLVETGSSQIIKIIVYRISGFSDLEFLEKSLLDKQNGIPGIRQLYRRSFEKGIAVLDAQIKGKNDAIAHAIQKKVFGRFKVVVTGTSLNVIKLTIVQN